MRIHPYSESSNLMAFETCLFLFQSLFINDHVIILCAGSIGHSASLVKKSFLACQWKSASRYGIQHFCRTENSVEGGHPQKIHFKIKLLLKKERKVCFAT